MGRASSALVDLRGSRQGPPQPFSTARRTSNSPFPRFAVAVGVATVGHAGAARTCRSCRSSVCHLYLDVCVCLCVGPGVKGLSLCWHVTCLHSRAPQAHLLVACWCSQRGLRRTICHPAAVMIASVLPGRPRAFCGRITHCCHPYQAVLTCVCVYMTTKLASVETQLGLLLRTICVFCCQSCCLRCVVGALAGSATLPKAS